MCQAAVRRRRQCSCEIAVVVVILDVISRCKIINSLANDEYPQSRAAPKRIRLTTSPTKHTPSGLLNLRGQVIDHNKMKSALFYVFFFRRRRRQKRTHTTRTLYEEELVPRRAKKARKKNLLFEAAGKRFPKIRFQGQVLTNFGVLHARLLPAPRSTIEFRTDQTTISE